MAIVKGNSLRIFSCKNENEPIMVERANFRGLKVSQRSGFTNRTEILESESRV